MGSKLDFTLLAYESRMRAHRLGNPPNSNGRTTPDPWGEMLPEVLEVLSPLPPRARQACTARLLEEIHLQAWAEATHDAHSAAVASGATDLV